MNNASNDRQIPNELVDAIATNRAVVYVGAGASVAADLMGWSAFLKVALDRAARELAVQPLDLTWMRVAYQEKNFPILAEVIQSAIGERELSLLVQEHFSRGIPSSLHRYIVRLPFSLAITTNYDSLLEQAYTFEGKQVIGLDWREKGQLWDVLRSNPQGQHLNVDKEIVVVKAHGEAIHHQSVVLTRRQYRDLELGNDEFRTYLETLLSTRTFCVYRSQSERSRSSRHD